MPIDDVITELAGVDLFAVTRGQNLFVGRPFHLDYSTALLLVADAWKKQCGGIPQGTFLLAFYENEPDVREALLLRAIRPAELPTDRDTVSSMVEYYKDHLKTSGTDSKLDEYTRYDFSFSGLECRVLGTFYTSGEEGGHTRVLFGADVENFYSAHNYSVYKPIGKALEFIANIRDSGIIGSPSEVPIGCVRYSSTQRFETVVGSPVSGEASRAKVYVSASDFLGKRTALFGMTRTGKSNTVKKIIQATMSLNERVGDPNAPFGIPSAKVGQIIFDINGEYANQNMQDDGTAIYQQYPENLVKRYSVLEKSGFQVLRTNFYTDIVTGFELVKRWLRADKSEYVKSFLAVDLSPLGQGSDRSDVIRHSRRVAAYLCCLHAAKLEPPASIRKVYFQGEEHLNSLTKLNPRSGLSFEDATNWFTAVWSKYTDDPFFKKYESDNGHGWADEDLKAILRMLTRQTDPGKQGLVNGFIKLRGLATLHQNVSGYSYESDILGALRGGKIVIVDLSQGDPELQALYSDRICTAIFQDATQRFIKDEASNCIQFYFEEAHNLFPKKNDEDLTQIYQRIAKEGAKLNLGLIYATQEVSSISANILKNTQNWFVAHLNNEDELREIRKYYDFGDFADSLLRFSAGTDKGFVRMKTYSNPFVVPVQVDRFKVPKP